MPGFFPMWVVIAHFLNIFFMLLLARSGISACLKLYWNDHCTPAREWLRLSKKTFSASRPRRTSRGSCGNGSTPLGETPTDLGLCR